MIQEVQRAKESERIPEPSRTVQRRWLESSGQLLREFPCEFPGMHGMFIHRSPQKKVERL